uniref:Uncharacterized protein n=1 Tax=Kwoniella bestiolae CBS 10118 TaxID=1296100 RepID=A0A1B9FSS3_9TREE|nr:hypothetical protein I302_08600 [Kwoniella bestiolae CBS 10118]OCF21821.1 hypothetical protein I302_08600 [Kwoniella bestiolae CBS 10118]
MGGPWNSKFYFAGPKWDKALENTLGSGRIDVIAYHTMGKNYVRFERWTAWTVEGAQDKGLELVKKYVNDVDFVRSNDNPSFFS